MTRSMLGRAELGVGQRLNEAFALGMLVQHVGEGHQHARNQCVGLGQCPRGAGEVTYRARVDHGHRQARGLQAASNS